MASSTSPGADGFDFGRSDSGADGYSPDVSVNFGFTGSGDADSGADGYQAPAEAYDNDLRGYQHVEDYPLF